MTRTLLAFDFMTVSPTVTCPSPPSATAPLRRTARMVVARMRGRGDILESNCGGPEDRGAEDRRGEDRWTGGPRDRNCEGHTEPCSVCPLGPPVLRSSGPPVLRSSGP